jgi:hypothetical protein
MRDIACRVSDSQRQDPDFRRKYERLQKELADPLRVINICIHESGHLIYYRRARLPAIKLQGPAVSYDPLALQFEHSAACVEIGVDWGKTNYDAVAKGAAAGGVFTAEIAKQSYCGDANDLRNLGQLLRTSCAWLTDETVQNYWKAGQLAVDHDLRTMDDSLKREIETTVTEIGQKCFDIEVDSSFPARARW